MYMRQKNSQVARSNEEGRQHPAADIRQSLVPPVVEPGQFPVVEPHQVQQGRVDVVDVGLLVDGVELSVVPDPELLRRRIRHAAQLPTCSAAQALSRL